MLSWTTEFHFVIVVAFPAVVYFSHRDDYVAFSYTMSGKMFTKVPSILLLFYLWTDSTTGERE